MVYIYIVAVPVKAAVCTYILLKLRIFQHQFIVDWFSLFENLCIITVAKLRKKVCVCVCVFQCQPPALLRASGSAQGG